MERLSREVGAALATADLAAYAELLDPDVRWGPPGDAAPPCRSREQVLEWYRRGWQEGVRADVTEISVGGDQILIGLHVTAAQGLQHQPETKRWQLLTVHEGRVADIVGFETRADAVAFSARGFESA